MDRLLETLAVAAAAGPSFADAIRSNDDAPRSPSWPAAPSRSCEEDERLLEAELLIHARRLFPGGGDGWDLDDSDDDESARRERDEHFMSLRRVVRLATETANRRRSVAQDTNSPDGGGAVISSGQSKKMKSSEADGEAPGGAEPRAAAATITGPASFSLLDQLDSSRWLLASLVSPEQVREAESPQDKLVLLQQIGFLDPDELLAENDWEEVYVAAIRQALTPAAGAKAAASDAEPSRRARSEPYPQPLPAEVVTGYVELVQKWIDMADPTTSGGGMAAFQLQVDLIRTVTEALGFRVARLGEEEDECRSSADAADVRAASTSSVGPAERSVVTALFHCLWKTWMEWMLSYDSWGSGDDRVHSIGLAMWNVVAIHPAMEGMIVALDPLARWFSTWMAVLCYPEEILDTLCGGHRDEGRDTDEHKDGVGAVTPGNQIRTAWQRHVLPMGDHPMHSESLPACCYWLSIFRSLLVHLRMSHFPWSLLLVDRAAPATDATDGEHRSILFIAGLYLRLLSSLRRPEGSTGDITLNEEATSSRLAPMLAVTSSRLAPMQEVCLDALGTLLSGCGTQGRRRSTLVELRARIEAASSQPAMQVLESLL